MWVKEEAAEFVLKIMQMLKSAMLFVAATCEWGEDGCDVQRQSIAGIMKGEVVC